ncbi:unnamed protein product [Closterium sp. Yama58-4]|nr:unnamed protein product [Closterium sp. Yama58-4]
MQQLTSLSLVGVAAIPRLAPLAPSLLCLEIRGAGEGVTRLPGKCLAQLTCLQELVLRDCLALRQLPASLALMPSLQRIRVEGCYAVMLDAWTPRDGLAAAVPFLKEEEEREEGEGRRNGITRVYGGAVVAPVVSEGAGGASGGEDVEASCGQQRPPQWRRQQRRQRKKLHRCREKALLQQQQTPPFLPPQQQQQQVSQVDCQSGVTTVTAAAQPRQPLFFSKLQHFELADVSALHQLPRGILQHHSLKHLVLDGYSGGSLSVTGSVDPESTESTRSMLEPPIRMPSLQHLVLRNLPKLCELPECLSLPSACPSLTILTIENCPRLPSLLTLPPSLHTLKLHNLPNLSAICDPLRAHCLSLSVLVINQCANLHSVPCFPSRSLSHVEIRNLPNLTALTSPSALLNPSSSSPRLSILAIENCPLLAINSINATARPPLAFKFPSLSELWLHDLPLLHELPPSFSCLSSLQRLVITRCHGLNALPDCLPQLPLLRDLALVVNHNLTIPTDFLPHLHSVRRLVVHRGRENKTIIAHHGRVRPQFALPPRVKELHTDDFGSEVLRLHELERLEVIGENLAKVSINEIEVMEEVMKGSGEGGWRDAEEEESSGRFVAWVASVLDSSQSTDHVSLTHIHRYDMFFCPSEQVRDFQFRRVVQAYSPEEEHWENLASLQRVERCACCPISVPSEWQRLVCVVDAAVAKAAACGYDVIRGEAAVCGGDVMRRAEFVLGDLGGSKSSL